MEFKPAFGLKNRHLQTLFPAIFSSPIKPEIEREKFELEDGDFVDCVWHKKPSLDDNRPIVTLFHGLAGSFKSPYIQRAMNRLGDEEFAVVLMHFRGCGGEINRLPRAYHSGDTDDALAWFKYLKKSYPKNPLFAIGYSLGGNMLLKLLGELGSNSPIISAIAISAPMQLESSANTINSGFSKLYQYRLMKILKQQLTQKYLHHDMHSLIDLTQDDIQKLNSFWEFDDAYTAPIHGFKNAIDYYKKSSSKQFLKNIQTNTLIINALDDPFMSHDIIPCESELSQYIELELYPHGGHVGFVSGTIFKPKYWLEDRILSHFKRL